MKNIFLFVFFSFFLFLMNVNSQTKTRQLDSLVRVGDGWQRLLLTTIITTDTVERGAKRIIWQQTKMKDTAWIFVDPRIKKISTELLLYKKDQKTADSSIKYFFKDFLFYRGKYKTEKTVFWERDTIKLMTKHIVDVRRADIFMYCFILISVLLLCIFIAFNFFGNEKFLVFSSFFLIFLFFLAHRPNLLFTDSLNPSGVLIVVFFCVFVFFFMVRV